MADDSEAAPGPTAAELETIRSAFLRAVGEIEATGIPRGAIGAAMIGYGVAIMVVNAGVDPALATLDHVRGDIPAAAERIRALKRAGMN